MNIAFIKNELMRNNSFTRLTISQQADTLLREGIYLDSREEPGFFVDMYHLGGMYVEIYFHKKQEDFVVVKSFYSSEDVHISCTDDAETLYPLPLSWQNTRYAC
jgi:hypothetical protein